MQTEDTAVVNVEEEKDSNTFYCEHCTFETIYYSRLVSHSVVHSLERPYACEYCHYAAKRKSDLKKHLIHKHKLPDSHKLSKNSNSSSQSEGTSPSNSSQQQQQQSKKSIPVTYTLSPEQEVVESPESIHDDGEEISIHSGSNTPTIKVELNDDVEETSVHQFEYTAPLPTTSSFVDPHPVAINIPHQLYHHQRISAPFTPTIVAVGSHAVLTSHSSTVTSPELHSSSDSQSLIGTKGIHSNPALSGLTHSGPVSMKDISTLTNQCFFCHHCNILFFDNGLYVMHMGLHHSKNPWQCNLCGQVHQDVYSFTLHFITQHKS